VPTRPARACAVAGCPNKAAPGSSRCVEHARARKRESDRGRPSAAARGYDRKWRMNRARFLKAHPTCVVCGKPATDVDHIIPRREGGTDQWHNLQALCHECHSSKTARLDGGFGGRGGAVKSLTPSA